MRKMNCRNVRREIEEAAPGKWLSSDVNDHVLNCSACETLLREQTKLRELVSSLGTVAAPGDFDFRLRARLADEKRGHARPFTPGNFLLGLSPAAVVTILLLIGSVLTFVSFRIRLDNSASPGVAKVAPNDGAGSPVNSKKVVNSGGSEVAAQQEKQGVVVDASLKPDQQAAKHRSGLRQTALASLRQTNRQSTRDSSSTPAAMLKRDQVAGIYPTSAFPIDGGYQSLKVSLDDSRGTSRTISLPTVSFGSPRSLSQSAPPLMASARDAW